MVVNEQGELVPGELCTSGHEALGGIDMDDALIAYLADRYRLSGYEEDAAVKAILKDEVERAKIRLSSRETTMVDLPGGETVTLSQDEMEEVLSPLLEKCRGPVRVALQQAGIGAESLDHVLLIGGPTHMRCVRRMLEDELTRLGGKPSVLASLAEWDEKRRLVDPMECVAKGAALKAERIVEPAAKVLAEGYGTMYGPVEGQNNYYAAILDVNSAYPISARGNLSHLDPEALEVPVPLVAKRPDVERSTAENLVYRYEYIGDYNLSVTPTGRVPSVDIKLQVTDDKRVVAVIVHAHNRQQVRFEGLGFMRGEALELQEHTPPKKYSEARADIFSDSLQTKKGGWTREHLERHLHVAAQALALAEENEDEKVRRAADGVESAVRKAVASELDSPNIDCPNISNRIKELLDAMRQPEVNLITLEEFRHYMDQLIQVAKAL